MTGLAIGVTLTASCFGLVWHMWWLASLGVLGAAAFLILRSFDRTTERTVSADEVTATERRWHQALRDVRPIPRQLEMTPRNEGLAEIAA